MAHELASACQQVLGIGNLRAAKEPDVDVRFEGIDIGESRIFYTRGRVAVMQQFSDILAAVAHELKPSLCNHSQST